LGCDGLVIILGRPLGLGRRPILHHLKDDQGKPYATVAYRQTPVHGVIFRIGRVMNALQPPLADDNSLPAAALTDPGTFLKKM